MKLEFISEEHEAFFLTSPTRFNFYPGDIERLSMFYVLGLMPELRNSVSALYDAEQGLIIPEGLNDGFQTSGSKALTLLAFSLFNNFQEKKLRYPYRDPDDSSNFEYYSYPSLLNIFAPLDRSFFKYMYMAIDFRFGNIQL